MARRWVRGLMPEEWLVLAPEIEQYRRLKRALDDQLGRLGRIISLLASPELKFDLDLLQFYEDEDSGPRVG